MPFAGTSSEENIISILENTKLETLCISEENLIKIINFKNLGNLKNFIFFDEVS